MADSVIRAIIDSSGAQVGAAKFAAATRSMASSAQITARSILSLEGIVAGLGTALTAREFIQAGDNFSNLKSRLQLFAQEGTNASDILDAMTVTASRSHAPVGQLADIYSRNAAALNNLGYSTSDQIRLAETLYKTLVISGNATESGREALIQFSQSLNSGVFRGQEFNSVNEQATEIIRALARETGKTQGELRKLANDGALTAQVAVNGLLNDTKTIDSQFEKLPQTVTQASSQFSSAFQLLIGESAEATGSNRSLAEAINEWTKLLGSDAGREIIDWFSGRLKDFSDFAADAAREIRIMAAETAIVAEKQKEAADTGFTWAKALQSVWVITKEGLGFWADQAKAVANGTFGMTPEQQRQIRAQAESQVGWEATVTKASAVPNFDANSAKRAIQFGSSDDEKEARRRQKVTQELAKQLDIERDRVAITQAQIDGNQSQVQVLTTEMTIRQRISDDMRKYDPEKAAALENEIRLQDALAAKLKDVQEIESRNTAFAEDFASTITDGFASAIKGGQSFSQTLKQMGVSLLEVIEKAAVLEPLGKSIGSSLSSLLNSSTGLSGGKFDIGNLFGLGGGGDVGLGSWAPTVTAFAAGGVVSKPTGFAFSGGLGVAGEAGDEGIFPLTRTSNGDLGVKATGLGAANVTNVNITITGDATDATVAKMYQAAAEVFAQSAPSLVEQSTAAVAKRYRNEKNYLRR